MRLIDADKLKEAINEAVNDFELNLIRANEVVQIIDNAPTILTISENATNGDMIKALFPDFEFYAVEVYSEKFVEGTDDIYPYNDLRFEEEWWNAPYKNGGRE